MFKVTSRFVPMDADSYISETKNLVGAEIRKKNENINIYVWKISKMTRFFFPNPTFIVSINFEVKYYFLLHKSVCWSIGTS